jgi:hypothetical protein
MNSERLLHRQALGNGLILELWDHSRPVAGDRWYTRLETRIVIPVRPYLPAELKPLADQVAAALGEEIVFSHHEERNFIGAPELPGVLQDMQDRMLKLAPGYFGHEDFAAKFIRKTYAASGEPGRS